MVPGHLRLPFVAVLGQVTWNGRDDAGAPVASGVYPTRLIVGGDVLSRSMTLAE